MSHVQICTSHYLIPTHNYHYQYTHPNTSTPPHPAPYLPQGDKPFKAYQQVIAERPLAAVQIVLAIFAVEALGQFNQVCNGYKWQ